MVTALLKQSEILRKEPEAISPPVYPPVEQPGQWANELIKGGIAAAQAGRKKEAEKCFRRLLALQPDNPSALICLGNVIAQTGRGQEAEELFREALTLDPSDPIALINLGNILATMGRVEEAEESYRRALALQPDLADAHYNLGRLLAQKPGRLEEAERAYQKALSLRPDFLEALLYLGDLQARTKRLQEAEDKLRCAIELRPDLAKTHFALGRVLAVQKDRLTEAMAEFEATYALRRKLADKGAGLYRAWAVMLLASGTEAVAARDLNGLDKWTDAFIALERRARKDQMIGVMKEVTKSFKARLSKKLSPSLEGFLLSVKLMAIEDPWEGWNALAKEVSKRWPKGVSAVDAVREQRE